jgi:hypothetical protein
MWTLRGLKKLLLRMITLHLPKIGTIVRIEVVDDEVDEVDAIETTALPTVRPRTMSVQIALHAMRQIDHHARLPIARRVRHLTARSAMTGHAGAVMTATIAVVTGRHNPLFRTFSRKVRRSSFRSPRSR